MGLILDSSVLVAAERQGKNARRMMTDIAATVGDEEIALSVVTLAELAHGAARANTLERRNNGTRLRSSSLQHSPISNELKDCASFTSNRDGHTSPEEVLQCVMVQE